MLAALLLVLAGCGGNQGMQMSQNPQAISITVQPANQAIRLGQPASFSVTATGSEPSYQWEKNGMEIMGATASTFTIPVTAATDNNSTFTVIVHNSANSVTSRPATLVLNAPKPGDLRFQQVDSDVVLNGYTRFRHLNIFNGVSWTRTDYGSSLELSPDSNCAPGVFNCNWFFSFFNSTSPGTITAGYQDNAIDNLSADLATLGPGTVVTSLDLQRSNGIYGISWRRNLGSGGFGSTLQSVAAADLQSTADLLGSESQVITGIAFDNGNITVLSYFWQDDPATAYETKVVSTATLDGLPGAATSLAGEGYIITAVGGHPSDGFLLVGTRVQGDTMPRPLKILVSPTDDVDGQMFGQGYALIANFPDTSATTQTWIGEK